MEIQGMDELVDFSLGLEDLVLLGTDTPTQPQLFEGEWIVGLLYMEGGIEISLRLLESLNVAIIASQFTSLNVSRVYVSMSGNPAFLGYLDFITFRLVHKKTLSCW